MQSQHKEHTLAADLVGLSSSLREIFPTDAGQLSDRLKFLAGQNKILQHRRLVCLILNYNLFFTRITRHLSDKLKFSAGQKENLPVLSDSPAAFAKTVLGFVCFLSGPYDGMIQTLKKFSKEKLIALKHVRQP